MFKKTKLNYCSQCGSSLGHYVPKGDVLVRGVCDTCETIYYENPNIIVASIVECNHKILLCKRAIEPRLGYWALPGGYMENNETLEEAAIRETQEETKVLAKNMQLYALINCPNINQIYFIFRGKTQSEYACTSSESSEVNYFHQHEIPWNELSYSIMRQALDWYFFDREKDKYSFRMSDEYECYPESNVEI